MLSPLGLSPSFGFGDRIGLATPGHIAAVKGTKFAPVFAQQSVRENACTARALQGVTDGCQSCCGCSLECGFRSPEIRLEDYIY
jgi:hypothetical protein